MKYIAKDSFSSSVLHVPPLSSLALPALPPTPAPRGASESRNMLFEENTPVINAVLQKVNKANRITFKIHIK
jgi:hypothetical protein